MNKLTLPYFIIINIIMLSISIIGVPLFMDSINYSSIYGQESYDKLTPDLKQAINEKHTNWTIIAQIIPFLGGNIVMSFYFFGLRIFETPQNDKLDKYEQELKQWRDDDVKRKEQNKKENDLILKKYDLMPDISEEQA